MTERDNWNLGHTSLFFESSGKGPGTVSSGKGDHGGISYGTYQMSSNAGVVQDFVKHSSYAANFKDFEVNSEEFIAEWKRLADSDSTFALDQHDYIKAKNYDPAVRNLRDNGVDIEARGPAVKDMVWSTSVQYGGGATTTRLVSRGLREAYGDGYNLEDLSDSQVVSAVQDSKLRHVAEDFRRSPQQTPNIEARIAAEKHGLNYLAETGTPMADSELSAYLRSVSPMKKGAHGEDVAALQRDLAGLGYFSRSGASPSVDGDFGQGTEDALKAFQRASGLVDHGQASVLTRLRLSEQAVARDQGMVELQERSATMPTCRLDDPSHPDHGMFQATRVLVHDLDRSHGRVPDERSDNLAASLVIAGRRAGLERVDQIALSDDASRLWGVQRPPGARDHFFDRQASTNTVQAMNTPVSESSNRWPEAMQAYEMVRNNEIQDRQQALSQQQTQSHGGPAMSLTR